MIRQQIINIYSNSYNNNFVDSTVSGSITYTGNTFNNKGQFNSNVGINVQPINTFDINGKASIGTYAGNYNAPQNGVIISGNVGIGTTNPQSNLHVNGSLGITYSTSNLLLVNQQQATFGFNTLTIPYITVSNLNVLTSTNLTVPLSTGNNVINTGSGGITVGSINTQNNLINIGSGDLIYINKTKYKISNTLKNKYRNGYCLSKEARHKISEAHKGKKVSEKTKDKISEAHKGKILSQETKNKISESQIGKKQSDSQKIKVAEKLAKKYNIEAIDLPRKGNTTAEVQQYQYELLHKIYLEVKKSLFPFERSEFPQFN